MSHKYKCGLVVGKFAPLHLGHQLLIKRALSSCEQVIVISYSKPEFAGCDCASREAWLAQLFPQVTRLVIDDQRLAALCAAKQLSPIPCIPPNTATDQVQREFVAWLCWSLLGITVDAVFTSEDYGDGFARVLGEYFSQRSAAPHRVAHVSVDRQRQTIPISGTAIRLNPHAHRQYICGAVYAKWVQRVCILGAESSGKSTLAQALAARLDTVWAAEYGRELWEQQQGQLRYADMLHIAQTQVQREQQLCMVAQRLLICDTSPLTTLFYSHALFACADPQLEVLAGRDYDYVFLCVPDFAFVQDGTRQDEGFSARQHQWYLGQLAARGVTYSLLTGPLESRLNTVIAALNTASDYSSAGVSVLPA
jgi:HTH-type transcriptional repressor of NAD biosynthesis genes